MSAETVKLINNVKHLILNPIIGFMFAVATVMFIYGITEYILGAENEDVRSKGKRHMIYGVIGMFVMISAYGIINILSDFWWDIESIY
ncbi:MAG: hypothetical protein HUT38_00840 [Candidatus Paceibacter sp.]|nr:hypothetical protein [Candidatus Paceibacter sp.]